jgi:hypothetical protein
MTFDQPGQLPNVPDSECSFVAEHLARQKAELLAHRPVHSKRIMRRRFQMKTRLLLTTAVGLVFATAAFAQSPRDAQTQTPSTAASTTQKAPDTTTKQAPSNSSSTTPDSRSQAQTAPSASSQPSGTSQAQTNAPPASNNQAQQAPAGGSSTTTAQQPAQPANPPTNTAQQPAQPANPPTNTAQQPAQPANPPSNTAQQPAQPANPPTNTAQQPAQSANPPTNTAQSSSTKMNASVNINDQQRTRVAQSISRLNVQPVTNVNFSLSVGTVIPRDVRLQTLPADVVDVVPQFRGFSFFAVRGEIVIVEPSTSKIVAVLPRSGGNTAAAPAPSRSKVSFTDKDREVVRKHVQTRTERQPQTTTGSAAKTVIRRGERLPDSVEVEEFPETVYREAPALRDYRYIHRDNRTYVVEPTERTVIEEID